MTRLILQGLALVAAAALGYHAIGRAAWYQPGAWAVRPAPLIEGLVHAMPEGCRFFSEANLLNYNVTDARPFMFFSKYSRPLFEAEDEEAIDRFLGKENLCFLVTLRASYLERMSPDTPLMRFLEDERYAIRANGRKYDPRGYYRWVVFRRMIDPGPRLVVLGTGTRLAWHPDGPVDLAGKKVTVSYLMRSRTPDLFAAVISDGIAGSKGPTDPGDGRWSWGYVEHVVSDGSSGMEISFGPPVNTNEPGLLELAGIVISVDGEKVAGSAEGFDAWRPDQPLPHGWLFNKPGASLFVSRFE